MSTLSYSKHNFNNGDVLFAEPLNEMDTQIETVTQEVDKKQDTLVFNTTYSATSNKAATMTDITNAIDGAISKSY